jgi:hypothetical protein
MLGGSRPQDIINKQENTVHGIFVKKRAVVVPPYKYSRKRLYGPIRSV